MNVSGTWSLSLQGPNGRNAEPILTLQQTGDSLTGTVKGNLGEMLVKGTVEGTVLNFVYTVEAQGQKMDIKYDGTTDGVTMNGAVTVGQMGTGTFSGRKR